VTKLALAEKVEDEWWTVLLLCGRDVGHSGPHQRRVFMPLLITALPASTTSIERLDRTQIHRTADCFVPDVAIFASLWNNLS